MSFRCPHNMVNIGPLMAEIGPVVWGTLANFNGFHVLAALLHGSQVVSVSQTLRRWTEGATYVQQGDHHVGHWTTFLVTDGVAWSIRVSVCQHVNLSRLWGLHTLNMPFGLLTRVGPRNHVLDGGPDPHRKGQFWGGKERPIMKYRGCLQWAVQKWPNQSSCRLSCHSSGPKKACIMRESRSPVWSGNFEGKRGPIFKYRDLLHVLCKNG